MNPGNHTRSARFESLDALRGVAILAVMLLHFCERGQAPGDSRVHAWLWPVVSHGYLGVQLFFVISGYCITTALYATASKPKPWRTFLARRARRIYPPYWWSLLLVIVLGLGTCMLMRKPWGEVFPLTARDWFLNAVLLQQPFQAPDANMVYWSLSIEVQFYALMSLCLLFRRWTEPFLVLISAGSAWLVAVPQSTVAGTVLVYWPQFACGIAAYYFITRQNAFRATPWLLTGTTLAALIAHRMLYSPTTNAAFSGVELKLTVCLAVLVLLVLLYPHDARLACRRELRPLAWLGIISYSLYLTHVPIGTRVFNVGERLSALQEERWLLFAVIAFVASTAIGVVFHRYCEQPWMNAAPIATPTPGPSLDGLVVNRA